MPLPEDTAYLAASVAGGAAAAVVNKSTDSRWRKVSEGFVGALTAIFVGPSIAAACNVHEPRDIIAMGFITATAGYGAVTAIVDWAKGATVRDWLGRFVGPPRPPSPS